MKLEIGKRYLTRNGRRAKIATKKTKRTIFEFVGFLDGENGMHEWAYDGLSRCTRELDLVSEVAFPEEFWTCDYMPSPWQQCGEVPEVHPDWNMGVDVSDTEAHWTWHTSWGTAHPSPFLPPRPWLPQTETYLKRLHKLFFGDKKMEFKVGDIVGHKLVAKMRGTVIGATGVPNSSSSVQVVWDGSGGHNPDFPANYYTCDGRARNFHTEPSIYLVSRQKSLVKKSLKIYAVVDTQSNTLMGAYNSPHTAEMRAKEMDDVYAICPSTVEYDVEE